MSTDLVYYSLSAKYTRTGKYYDEVFTYLKELSLEDEAEASRANKLGELVRD